STMPTLERSAAGIIWIGAVGSLVIRAYHLDRFSGFQIIERNVHGTAAVVTRTLRRISNEKLFVVRCGVPKHFSHIPGPVTIVDQQTITERFKSSISANDRLGRRTLHERASLRIENRAEQIIVSGVADIQIDRRIKFSQFDQISRQKISGLVRRLRCKRLLNEY